MLTRARMAGKANRYKDIRELKSMNSPQEHTYSYEGLTQYAHLAQRKEYLGELTKKRVKDKLAKKGLQSFKAEVMQRTKDIITGEESVQEEERKEDTLWQGRMADYSRKYDRVYAKELNWYQQDEATPLHSAYKTAFLFQTTLQDQEVRTLIQELTDIRLKAEKNISKAELDRSVLLEGHDQLLERVRSKVEDINIRHLPQLVFELGHLAQFKGEQAAVWQAAEDRLFKYLHTFDLDQLALIKMGLISVHPKRGNAYLHKAIDDLVEDSLALNTPTLDSLLPLYHSYRTNIKETHDTLFRSLILKAKPEVEKRV